LTVRNNNAVEYEMQSLTLRNTSVPLFFRSFYSDPELGPPLTPSSQGNTGQSGRLFWRRRLRLGVTLPGQEISPPDRRLNLLARARRHGLRYIPRHWYKRIKDPLWQNEYKILCAAHNDVSENHPNRRLPTRVALLIPRKQELSRDEVLQRSFAECRRGDARLRLPAGDRVAA
jgi:hypothetical protein